MRREAPIPTIEFYAEKKNNGGIKSGMKLFIFWRALNSKDSHLGAPRAASFLLLRLHLSRSRIPLSAEITAELIHTLPAGQTDRRKERETIPISGTLMRFSRLPALPRLGSLGRAQERDEGIAEGPARYLVSVLLRPLSRLIKLKFI